MIQGKAEKTGVAKDSSSWKEAILDPVLSGTVGQARSALRYVLWKPIANLREKGISENGLAKLEDKNIIPGAEYDEGEFLEARGNIRTNCKGDKKSSIGPDEERLIYATGVNIKPKTVIGVGSYFGYAVAWIVSTMPSDGKAYLIDPDPNVCAQARANFEKMGLLDRVEIIEADFFDCKDNLPDVDLVWIDASGPKKHPKREYRHKKIYAPIIEALDPKIKTGGIIMAHNVIPFSRKTGNFVPYAEEHFQSSCRIPTSGGLFFAKK